MVMLFVVSWLTHPVTGSFAVTIYVTTKLDAVLLIAVVVVEAPVAAGMVFHV
jgi:hypothetical protein